MKETSFQTVYGPVPSRRLGKSLGINNIPAKVCTYSCVYCQVGRTTTAQVKRRTFYAPDDILQDVQHHLVKVRISGERADYLTFVPDGEPTLDINLGKEIALLKELNVPIGVITNSSLIFRDDVKDDLGRADWVSLKIDTVSEPVWRRINRPNRSLSLSKILDGILDFARHYKGKLVTETMLVRNLNDSEEHLRSLAAFIVQILGGTSYLSVPIRPPAEKGVQSPAEEALVRAYQIMSSFNHKVEYLMGYEGNAFASTGDLEQDLLSITAVHPMREEAVAELINKTGADWLVVEQMIAQGLLMKKEYQGKIFFARKMDLITSNKTPKSGEKS